MSLARGRADEDERPHARLPRGIATGRGSARGHARSLTAPNVTKAQRPDP